MLAKQGWRHMKNPSSLVSKVLKARYFPRGNFLNATAGHNPSYAWRSIIGSKNIWMRGALWRVGNGDSIRIWYDRWIPGLDPLHGGNLSYDNSRVSELIDEDTRWWNINKLQQLFPGHIVEAIKRIPLSQYEHEDSLIWEHENKGSFSVRSAYRVARLFKENSHQICTEVQSSQWWKSLWKITIPNKIKLFLWRVAHNLLPTYDNLILRGINLNQQCQVCGTAVETICHTLWECEGARRVWSFSKIPSIIPPSGPLNTLKWLEDNCFLMKKEVFGLFAVTMWKIWFNRLSTIFEEKTLLPDFLFRRGKLLFDEFYEANKRSQCPLLPKEIKWKPPTLDRYKLNCDGAMVNEGEEAGFGAVLRNGFGQVMVAASFKGGPVQNSSSLEALAILKAVILAKDLGFSKIEVESDAELIVNELASTTPCQLGCGVIIEDILHVCNSFEFCSFSFIRRSGNQVAHLLAKYATTIADSMVWMEETPSIIEQAVRLDFH